MSRPTWGQGIPQKERKIAFPVTYILIFSVCQQFEFPARLIRATNGDLKVKFV